MNTKTTNVFIGNTFPLTLIRREANINPISDDFAHRIIESSNIISFWGHSNTLRIASDYAGIDLKPASERPALELNHLLFPCLNGVSSGTILVLSPEYKNGFRPAIGVEVTPEEILGWSWLLVQF